MQNDKKAVFVVKYAAYALTYQLLPCYYVASDGLCGFEEKAFSELNLTKP